MKKIFTLMAAAVMALAANAKDFTDNLAVTVSGETTNQEQVISVEEVEGSDGLYNISIADFTFMNIPVGNINLTNVKGNSDSEGFVNFERTETTISFMNATVILNEGSRMKGDKLYLDLDISASILTSVITVDVIFGDNNFPKEYTDDLYVETSGLTEQKLPKQEATIVVTKQNDGKYTLALKNFILGPNATEGMAVGTVEMNNVEAVEEDGKIKLSTEQDVTIKEGDDPSVETWSMAGITVPVKMTAEMTDDKLTATIDITYDMFGFGKPEYMMFINVAFGYVPTGISRPTTTTDNGVEAIYDLSGRKLDGMKKGVNIIRKADGTTVKVLKK